MDHDEGSENKLNLWTESCIPSVHEWRRSTACCAPSTTEREKLQSAAEERNLVQELLLRAERTGIFYVISRTGEMKQWHNVILQHIEVEFLQSVSIG